MSWDEVEVDFGGDETANFGPRQESGTALFQVDTLSTISPRGEIISNPAIYAACGRGGFCAVAGCQVSVYDETCHNLEFTLSFGSEVDAVTWSEDGLFLVVAESNGAINFVDVELKSVLFSRRLLSRNQSDQWTKCFQQISFISGSKTGNCDLIVLAAVGTLFRFTKINLNKLNQAIEAKDLQLAKEAKEAITLEDIDTSNLHTGGAHYFTIACWQGMTHIVTCGKGDSVVAIWKCGKNTTTLVRTLGNELFDDVAVVQCHASTNGKWLFLLDEEHCLSVFDPNLILLDYWPDIEIEQFILMNYNAVNTGNKNREVIQPELQLVVLTPGPDYYLKVFTLPGMQCTYSLAVSKYCTLAEVLPNQEPIFLLEGSFEEYLSDIISVLRVRCLTEALPETRFNRLLHKKKFEEAEKFARQFQLDIELVYKVKTTDLLETAAPWNNYPADKGQMMCDELKSCMDNITDITFVVENCIQAALPTAESMYDLLAYAKLRLQKCESVTSTNQDTPVAQLNTKVLNVTHRLETFQQVHSNNEYSGSQWDIFLRANMLEEILKWLSLGHLTEAGVIWKRHKPEFQDKITEDILQQLLMAIPETSHSTQLSLLLHQDIIPFVIHSFPLGKRPLAKWMEEKAKNMEISEKADWPMNSLKFAELFFTTNQDTRLSPEQYTTELSSKTTCTAGASQLWVLVQKLRALLHLHTKYNCKMPLAEYDQETTNSIVFRMLDRVVAIELIPSTIQTTIRPYMKEHGLSQDKLLLQYIEDLLDKHGKQSAYTYESSWEAKAIAVINCMEDIECHIMGIFSVMSCANMPWSRALEKVIHDGLALKHSKVAVLKERYNLLQLKKMLTKYELTQHNVLDKTTAQTVMRYIICQDKPDSLQDALKVVVAYSHMKQAEAYLFHIRFLITKNRIEEAVQLLKTLPASEAKTYCKRTVIWAKIALQSPLNSLNQECISETQLITQAAVTLLHFMLHVTDDPDELHEMTQDQLDLKSILALQTEYGEFLTIEKFRDESLRKSILTKYLVKFYTNKDFTVTGGTALSGGERKSRKSNESKKNFGVICRLGELLKYNAIELHGQVAITAARTGQVETALRMAKDLSSQAINGDIAETLYTIVHILSKLWAEENKAVISAARNSDVNLMSNMLSLAQQAATHCNDDLLCDCLELCKNMRLASSVFHQCESGDYGIAVQTSSSSAAIKDPYQDWSFNDFFKEDTLVMDSAVVMPLVYQLIMSNLPLRESNDRRLPLQHSRIGGRGFVTTHESQDKKQSKKDVIPDMPSSSSHLEKMMSSAMSLLQHLQENNQYEIALKVLLVSLGSCLQHFVANATSMDLLCDKGQTNIEQQMVMEIGKTVVDRLKQFTSTILMKVCGSRRVDCALGLGYISILSKQTGINTLTSLKKNAGQNYRKLLAISTIGEALAYLNDEPDVMEHCKKLITNAKWGKRLSNLKIEVQDRFTTVDIESKRQLLGHIVKHRNVDVDLIREYCRAFEIIDMEDALCLHLDMLLLPSHQHAEEQINSTAIYSVLSSISDTDIIVKKLSDAIDKVDSYDYERLRFIMENISRIQKGSKTTHQNVHDASLGSQLLTILSGYTRKSAPSQYELDFHCVSEEEQLRGIQGRLSPLAKTRLPYHPLLQGGQWKILSPELNEETVQELLCVCKLLRLASDQVYVVTIQNVITAARKFKSSVHGTDDISANGKAIDIKVLEKVQKLLLCIGDPNMAIATARYVAKELPLGPEKVMALKMCEMLARFAVSKCPENSQARQKAELLHQKLSAVYRAVATEQILHRYHLASKNLLSLVETPASLIFMLYEHSSIQKRTLGKQEDLPDIHAAAHEITTVNNLDISKIWMRLIETWLPHPSASKQADDEQTMNISLVSLDESSHTEEEKSLKRVIYVLQAGDIHANAVFLLNYAFKMNSTKITNACRVRALRCLFTLQDVEEIEKIAQRTIIEIREYMANLLYLCKLEHLNIAMDLEAFKKVDKEGLVRGLWRNHSRKQKAVRLVADLCIDYKIHDSQLWNSILLQLIQFNMMDFLNHVLSSLAAIPDLWQIECLPRAWRSVLLAPFTAVCAPLTEEQEDNCRQSAILLQSCPMAMSLDLMSLCKQFMKVEMFAEALGCLLYLPELEKKHNQIQNLLSSQCHVAILDEIAKVEGKAQQMPQAAKIKAAVFHNLAEKDNYSLLQSTKHFTDMINYFVTTKDVRGLLKRALASQNLNEAVEIVSLYSSQHPDTPSVHGTFNQQTSGVTKLRCYLKTHSMGDLLHYVPSEPRLSSSADSVTG